MKKIKQYPTQNELNELFVYRHGYLFWKKATCPRINTTLPAGWNEKRYRSVKINNKPYKIHRLIWILQNGEIPDGLVIDHINGDTFDNRIENLRIASLSLNQHNQVKRIKKSSTGCHGVYKHNNKYVARITKKGKSFYIGSFNTIAEAKIAYEKTKKEQIDLAALESK